MNTRELALLQDLDDQALQDLVPRYVRTFRRFPDYDELVRFQRAREWLMLRIPAQRRRRHGVVAH